jgi:hypothetical protein
VKSLPGPQAGSRSSERNKARRPRAAIRGKKAIEKLFENLLFNLVKEHNIEIIF